MAMPDATAARSESRIVLILSTVSQDGLDTSYVMRFWDIFSLAPTPKRLASLQRRPDGKSFYSSFLIQSCGSVVPIHYSFSHAFDPPLGFKGEDILMGEHARKRFFHAEGPVDTKLAHPAARNTIYATAFVQPGERHGAYFGGLPRFAKTNPRASAVQRSRLANLSASLRSGPGGIWRASSKASAAR